MNVSEHVEMRNRLREKQRIELTYRKQILMILKRIMAFRIRYGLIFVTC